jgi:hypothetical protein
MFARLFHTTNPSNDGRLNAPQELTGHRSTNATSWNTIALSALANYQRTSIYLLCFFPPFQVNDANGRGATEWEKAKNGMEPSFINGVGLEYPLNVLHGQL